MKWIFLVVSCLYHVAWMDTDVPYQEIERAFRNQDARELSAHVHEKLFISMFDVEKVYSAQQSSEALKQFFSNYPLRKFEFIFKGKETSEGAFAIASYQSAKQELRITFHFKRVSGAFKILRINVEES
ncbi:MAG: DUF4783 domain-containing protein [Bacteroidetes bacterium]|nr:MAG: DUF4783 domain-containing protein [Bacteroidota bacterium]